MPHTVSKREMDINGVRLHVKESGNGRNAIVFVHGNSMSADSWLPQLEDETLRSRYRLVALDLPGCGRSDRLPNYSFAIMKQLLGDFLHALDADAYITVGLSVGTNYIAEAAPYLRRCLGYALLSPCITNDAQPPASFFRELPGSALLFSEDAPEDEVLLFARRLLAENNEPLLQRIKTDFRHTDPKFRSALGADVAAGNWGDEIGNLARTQQPVLIVFGKEDPLPATNYLDHFPRKWNDRVYVTEGAGHFLNSEQPAAVNALLAAYAGAMFSNDAVAYGVAD